MDDAAECFVSINLRIGHFQYIKISLAVRLRGHKQKKLSDHVYSFLLFVSSRPHIQAVV